MKNPLLPLASALLLALAAGAPAQDITPAGSFGSYGSDPGQFAVPNSVAVYLPTGQVFVADQSNRRISRFSAAGLFEKSWGAPGSGDGQFNFPKGVAVNNATGEVFVGDSNNNRIQVFDLEGNYLRQWSTAFTRSGQTVGFPQDLAVSQTSGVVYEVTTSQDVQRFDPATGALISRFKPSQGALYIGINPSSGEVLVGNSSAIVQRLAPDGTAQGLIGNPDALGSDDGQFINTTGIATDAAGNIYVADTQNYRVQVFNAAGVFQTKFGVQGSGSGEFNRPFDLAFGNGGVLYVLEDLNYRVSRFQTPFTPPATAAVPPAVELATKKKITTTRPSYTLKGSVRGAAVASVQVKVGKGKFKKAKGTPANWSFKAPLKIGVNKILVQAVAADGTLSPAVKTTIVRQP